MTTAPPIRIGLPAVVCAQLRAALEVRGLSQRDLGGIVGVSQPMMSKILSGRRLPSPPLARLLCNELALDDEQRAPIIWAADAHARDRIARRRTASRS